MSLRPSSDPLTNPLLESEPIGEEAPRNRPPQRASMSFVVAVGIAALPMLLFGYHTGVLNAPESVIFPGHSVLAWSLAVSAFCVGGFLGSANAGPLADRHGRRTCLLVLLGINGMFGMLHVVAPNMTVLIGARVGVGLAGGAATVLTPTYLAEVAPPDKKGSIGTLTQLACVLGILGSILYALPFCTEESWRWIFVPLPVTSWIGVLVGYFWLPESPRWLLLHHYNTHGDRARSIIRQFRNLRPEADVGEVEMEVLLMTNNGNPSASSTSQNDAVEGDGQTRVPSVTFRDFCLNSKNRIPLVSAILFPIAQQLSGINAVFYYSTLFFDGVISDPKVGTIVAFAVNVAATILALLLMDKLGRKTLLSWSAGGMGLCCILLTLSLQKILPPSMTVFCVLLYITFFELGLGCIPFFLASELIEPQFLGTVQSISMASNWFSNFCVGLFFPYMNKFLGAYSFVPFGFVLAATVWYALYILPETRGKSLEMVLEELGGREDQPIGQNEEPNELEIGASSIDVNNGSEVE